MGRLKFRTSYGQNVLNHSKEVAFLAGIMARELGLNAQVATRAAFLHDIGKAIDRDLQGTHLELGLDFLQEARRIGARPARGRRPSHGHRLAVARSHDRPGCRRDFSRPPRRPPRHPRVLREAAREARRASRTPSRASRRPLRCRPAVRSASSSKASVFRTRKRSGFPKTSPAGSKTSWNTPARSRSRSSVRRVLLSTPVSDISSPITALGERGLIALIQSRFPASPELLPVGIGDDAAVAVPARGMLEVLTTDALVEGVHFDLRLSSPADVGYKALAVNVSDVAAMGGKPRLALLSLIVPERMLVGELDRAPRRLRGHGQGSRRDPRRRKHDEIPGPSDCRRHRRVRSGPRKVLTRGGGRPGDGLYLTGTVGAAAAGLEWLRTGMATWRSAGQARYDGLRYALPPARAPVPSRLDPRPTHEPPAPAWISVMVSRMRYRQLAGASGTGAVIDARRLPIPEAAAQVFRDRGAESRSGRRLRAAMTTSCSSRSRPAGGVVSSGPGQARGIPITRIGELTPAPY